MAEMDEAEMAAAERATAAALAEAAATQATAAEAPGDRRQRGRLARRTGEAQPGSQPSAARQPRSSGCSSGRLCHMPSQPLKPSSILFWLIYRSQNSLDTAALATRRMPCRYARLVLFQVYKSLLQSICTLKYPRNQFQVYTQNAKSPLNNGYFKVYTIPIPGIGPTDG